MVNNGHPVKQIAPEIARLFLRARNCDYIYMYIYIHIYIYDVVYIFRLVATFKTR